MENEIVILEMIKSVSETIKNVRFWLLVSTIACALTFISVYNASEEGWFTIRQKQYQYLNELIHKDSTKSLCEIVESEKKNTTDDKSFQSRILSWLEDKVDNGKRRCDALNLEIRKNDLAKFWSERRYTSIYTVHVPWLGIEFDINDLGIIAGFFLTIFLLVLLYQFGLRYSNLDKLFEIIDSFDSVSDKKLYFELSTFSIILKLPKKGSKDTSTLILQWVPYLLFFLPPIVYGYLFYVDFSSYTHIIKIYPNVVTNLLIEAVFLFIILIMTYNIYRLDKETDIVWDKYEMKFTQTQSQGLETES